MRELSNNDIYLLSEIIDKMNMEKPAMPKIKDETDKAEVKKANKEYGVKLFRLFLRNMYKAKDSINFLLASMTEKSVSDIEKMSGKETLQTVLSLFGNDGFLDFFI